VLIQQPVYHPFKNCIKNNRRELVSNSLLLRDGRYEMDFADLAQKAADPTVKMAILCSPHNPVGRVWTIDELSKFAEICLANNVQIISDEIHCDLIYDGVEFTTFAKISPQAAQRSIICTAASKTFNVAGLKISNIIIPDAQLREAFTQTTIRNGVMGVNSLGLVATQAAYEQGVEWLTAVMRYIQDNAAAMTAYLAEHLPMLKLIPPEGTYLAWLDCRALEMDPKERKRMLFEQAKLYFDEGEIFGLEGTGFERINLACPRPLLIEALSRLKKVVLARSR
jgi:cystathionine beta-lyase